MSNYERKTKKDNKKLDHDQLVDKVNDWMSYFHENIKRFNYSTKFVSKTTIDDRSAAVLDELGKPLIEFNAIAQEISRQRGEFAMNEPGFEISLNDGVSYKDIPKNVLDQMQFIEGHIRHNLSNQSNDMLQYRTFSNQTMGGWAAWEIKEKYSSKKSLEKQIELRNTYHPTMTGFDPTAILSHKGDGDYCFELVPMRKKEYERTFETKYSKNKKYYANKIGDVTWSYLNSKEEMVLVCYFYHKSKKKVKLMQLTDGQMMTSKEYGKFISEWEDSNSIGIPPSPIPDREKYEDFETIYRYVFTDCDILEYEKTDLPFLPYIFVDGNSSILSNDMMNFEQFTCPLVHHAIGAQKLKDMLGQTAAYEIENWVQSPFLISRQALDDLPSAYLDDWKTPQKKSLLVYNAIASKGDENAIPPPIQIQKQQTPQILTQLFFQMDILIQNIMGSHSAQMSQQGPHISGKSQMQAMVKASSATKPYVENNAAAMERVAEFYLHWIPKNMLNERIAPIIDRSGKHDLRPINHKDSLEDNVFIDFDPDMFKIKVRAGNSVSVQKDLSLESLRDNSKAFPALAALVNEKGLDVILDNLDMRGIEKLRFESEEYMNEMAEAKKKASENRPPDPVTAQLQIAQMQNQIEQMKIQMDAQIEQAKLSIDKQKADTEYLEVVGKISKGEADTAIQAEKIDAQMARTHVMEAAEIHSINHDIRKDHHNMRLEQSAHELEKELHELKKEKHKKEMRDKEPKEFDYE